MGLFSRRREQRERQMQDELLARLDGKELHYVVRRSIDENGSPSETVLGKGGRIMTATGHVIVMVGDKEVFRNETPGTVSCGELLSLNGAQIKGYNALTGAEDTLIAYYAYYRK